MALAKYNGALSFIDLFLLNIIYLTFQTTQAQNVAAIAGSSVSMSCNPAVDQWDYRFKSTHGERKALSRDDFYNRTLYRISRSNDSVTFTILSAKMEDAGVYYCYRFGAGKSLEWITHVFVISQNLSCHVSKPERMDNSTISCILGYHGTWHPVVHCFRVGLPHQSEHVGFELETINSDDHADSTGDSATLLRPNLETDILMIKRNSSLPSSPTYMEFMCRVYFRKKELSEILDEQDSRFRINVPEFTQRVLVNVSWCVQDFSTSGVETANTTNDTHTKEADSDTWSTLQSSTFGKEHNFNTTLTITVLAGASGSTTASNQAEWTMAYYALGAAGAALLALIVTIIVLCMHHRLRKKLAASRTRRQVIHPPAQENLDVVDLPNGDALQDSPVNPTDESEPIAVNESHTVNPLIDEADLYDSQYTSPDYRVPAHIKTRTPVSTHSYAAISNLDTRLTYAEIPNDRDTYADIKNDTYATPEQVNSSTAEAGVHNQTKKSPKGKFNESFKNTSKHYEELPETEDAPIYAETTQKHMRALPTARQQAAAANRIAAAVDVYQELPDLENEAPVYAEAVPKSKRFPQSDSQQPPIATTTAKDVYQELSNREIDTPFYTEPIPKSKRSPSNAGRQTQTDQTAIIAKVVAETATEAHYQEVPEADAPVYTEAIPKSMRPPPNDGQHTACTGQHLYAMPLPKSERPAPNTAAHGDNTKPSSENREQLEVLYTEVKPKIKREAHNMVNEINKNEVSESVELGDVLYTQVKSKRQRDENNSTSPKQDADGMGTVKIKSTDASDVSNVDVDKYNRPVASTMLDTELNCVSLECSAAFENMTYEGLPLKSDAEIGLVEDSMEVLYAEVKRKSQRNAHQNTAFKKKIPTSSGVKSS